MNGILATWWMLANTEAFRAAARYIHHGRGDGTERWIMAATAGMIVLFWVTLYLIDRFRQGETLPRRPRSLFDELCQAHQLSTAQCQLLSAVARHAELDDAAEIFLRPSAVRDAAAEFPGSIAQLNTLGETLFGEHWSDYHIATYDTADALAAR